jgi:hypothetical protein
MTTPKEKENQSDKEAHARFKAALKGAQERRNFVPHGKCLGISGFMADLNSPRLFKISSTPSTSIFMATGGVLGKERVTNL